MSTNMVTGEPKKHKQLNGIIKYLINSLRGTVVRDENEELINMVFKAKQEMIDAQCYFDSVTAPDLVDYAIYRMEAAKSQYAYLLKLAKDRGKSMDM